MWIQLERSLINSLRWGMWVYINAGGAAEKVSVDRRVYFK
jgi:hypothetical protein